MKVCLLAPALPTSDPSDAIARHAEGLARGGHDVVLAITDERPSGPAEVRGVRAVAVEDALAPTDVAVATTWDAAVRLFDVPARRHAFWVDGLGFARLAAWQIERVPALAAYDLPVAFLCAAPWVEAVLAERRPDARRLPARSGLDHAAFASAGRSAGDGPLRVLVDPRGDGAAAVAEVTVPVVATTLDPARRAAQLRDADVLVMLDPVDGVLGTPLEAACAGAVPVVLPAGGQADLVEHLVSGIVATPEDARGTARWLDRLGADRVLLGTLRDAAQARAVAWPSWEAATAELEGALASILDGPPPDGAWPARLMGDLMTGVAAYRNDHFVLTEELLALRGDGAVQAALRWRERVEGSAVGPLVRALRGRRRA